MLADASSQDWDDIVSWQPHGKAFRVHKPLEFTKFIVPHYFNQTKYKSFQRQLLIYGFQRIRSKGVDQGAYFHERFVRDDKQKCFCLPRRKQARRIPDFSKESEAHLGAIPMLKEYGDISPAFPGVLGSDSSIGLHRKSENKPPVPFDTWEGARKQPSSARIEDTGLPLTQNAISISISSSVTVLSGIECLVDDTLKGQTTSPWKESMHQRARETEDWQGGMLEGCNTSNVNNVEELFFEGRRFFSVYLTDE